MPHDWYVQALIKATILIGNSSSGLIETPLLRIPVIDIGPRQEGRERGANVLRCAHSQSDIAETAERALSDPVFQAAVQSGANPFGDGKASPTIVRILRDLEINAKLLAKRLTI
jgi:GDP/UDP-N,N'-diacetylbacillosamine 2-epimerase (hydrolysing)